MTKNSEVTDHQCRPDCGACCITPSISSVIPGMLEGKPANIKCINLNENLLCTIFNHPQRPQVCWNFKFDPIICGKDRAEAMKIMQSLEK